MLADPYQILGVAPDAAPEQIRQAYRRAAKRCHPDAGGTHEAMLRVVAAWEILGDPHKRSVYDRQRQAAAQPNATASAQWQTVEQEAQAAAQQRVNGAPADFADFVRWLDETAGGVQARPLGRLASGMVGGLMVGTIVGAFAGWVAGIGIEAGLVIGLLVGAAGGAIASWGRPATA